MERFKAIFDYVIELQPEERERVLEQISGENPELIEKVRLMLQEAQADTVDVQVTPVTETTLPPPKYIFTADDLIAGRYRVIRAIAKGGMGEVYEVQDLELQSRVALKVLNLKASARPNALEMFRREILLARQVTHPNVCRIYDLGHHDHAEHGDLLFLTMELVHGETLADRIRTQGPLTRSEALPLLRQMIQALSAAHRLNIAHRDFKSSNVILCEVSAAPGPDRQPLPAVPTAQPPASALEDGPGSAALAAQGSSNNVDSDGDTQPVEGNPGPVNLAAPVPKPSHADGIVVKVTDFGLARSLDGSEPTLQGEIWGTPAYMAPEQFRGHSSTSSDIYALGIVIYEMFAAKLPPRSIGTQAPGQLSAEMQKIPAEWQPVVQKCTAYEPVDRYARVDDVWVALKDPDTATTPRRIFGLSHRAAALLALVIFLVIGTTAWVERALIATLFRPIPQEKHIAVLRFQNIGDDAANAAFCAGVGETLASKLSELGEGHKFFWVVPFSDSQKYNDVEQARRNLNVNLVVTGSVQRDGDFIRLTANLIDADNHHQLASRVLTASVGDMNILQDQVWESVAEMVDLEVAASDKDKLQKGGTTKPLAYDYYEQGIGYLQRGDPASLDQAINAFHRSATEDPNYALAMAGLGFAYARKYTLTSDPQWLAKAGNYGNQAVALDPNLAPVREALGSIYETTGKLDEAKAEYMRALELNPSSNVASINLGNIYFRQGKYPEAEEAYQQIVKRMPSYWKGYNKLGELYFQIGRFQEASAEFKKVTETAPGNPIGYNNLAGTCMQMGKYQEAIAVLHKGLAETAFPEAWSNLGAAYMFTGEYEKAVGAMEKAVQMKPHDHMVWRNLADSYRQVPTLAGRAPETYRKALELAQQQVRTNPRDTNALSGIALYEAHLGNKAEAQRYIKQSLQLAPTDSLTLFTAAIAYELIGERERAIATVKLSLDAGFSLEDVKREPELRALRADPRYKKMLRQRAELARPAAAA